MRADHKRKALAQLAQVPDDATLSALTEEARRLERILETETQYDVLEEQLNLLDTFAFRVPDLAVAIIESLILRIGKFKITYSDEWIGAVINPGQYQNDETLTIKVIEVLIHLRYWATNSVLKLLLDLSVLDKNNLRKKAVEGLTAIADYDLAVFYGPQQKGGIGAVPQKRVIDQIEALDDPDLRRYQAGIVALAKGLLSPTMEATSATYKTVTWTKAPVPALPDVAEIRQRTIGLLKRLYGLAMSAPGKTRIIGTLIAATRGHHMASPDEDGRRMVAQDSIDVIEFLKHLAATEDLPIIQKIESEVYWIFRRTDDEEVKKAAQAVEAVVANNPEYQIYKQLVGFEGIFDKWSATRTRERSWRAPQQFRERKASQYAASIIPANYEEWRQRILRYAQTESDDLATFPIFFRFLNEFAQSKPELALRLISTDAENLQRFLVPLLRGLWASKEKAKLRDVIKGWIAEHKYLYQCTKMFMGSNDLDRDLLSALLRTAMELGERHVLMLMVSVAVSNYSEDKRFLLAEVMIPSIDALSKLGESQWIYDSWYRREMEEILDILHEWEIDIVIANLFHLKKIDYYAERVLALIATRFPLKVLDFFGTRLRISHQRKDVDSSAFDPIPYEFRDLNESLSKIPAEAVRIVRSWYDGGDHEMFIYEGARLLKNIFPSFPEEFQFELIKLIDTDGEEDLSFVLAILRNYEGQTFLHPVCRHIVQVLPMDSPLLTEVMIALQSTGVVTGEFGFAEAYERKASEIEDWLSDPDPKVSAFAKRYVTGLQSMSAAERDRAAEELELRKYRFGE